MNRSTRNRVTLLVIVLALMSSGIVYRLYTLQFVRSPQLHARAEDQHTRESSIEGKRGVILDRHGRELAVSLECGSLFVHPRKVQDPERAADVLNHALRTGRSRLLRTLRSDEPFVYLERGLEQETLDVIRASGLLEEEAEAFGLEMEGKRFYPGGRLAAHVIGFAGIDQAGLSGIEQARQDQLQGDPVSVLAVRDGRGQGFVQQFRPPSRPHHDVVLTLDLVLQHIAERELDQAIRETGAAAAMAVLMDPVTGQVLAMANRPAPDLNEYRRSRFAHQRNRAGIDLFEPGSTFKIVTSAAVLEQGAVSPHRTFFCENGRYRVSNRTYTDHEPFGDLTFTGIVEHSSNVGMIKIAHHIPGEVLMETVRRFGFGEITGLGLPEKSGNLPDLEVSPLVTRSSLAIGYGVGVTAVQLASAFATVANDGIRVPPRIVLGTRTAEGEWIPEPEPEPQRVVSGRTAAILTGMLEGVVRRGTGTNARLNGYTVAGKTGTARKYIENVGYSTKKYFASFGGFAPSRDPRLALLVVLDSPSGSFYYGGQTAAPVFARIMADSLAALRVPPEDSALMVRTPRRTEETETRPGPVPLESEGGGTVPDVAGLSLRDAVGVLNASGYRVRVTGRGERIQLSPPAGTRLDEGETCTLRLRKGDRS